jgi:hypothetical protein
MLHQGSFLFISMAAGHKSLKNLVPMGSGAFFKKTDDA